jgi:hypothetical protein
VSRVPCRRSKISAKTGHVFGLNFPVATNPARARGVDVMLKLDFQRAVLQRIPKTAATPKGVWRDILFAADEYHAFATLGETDPTGDKRTFALSPQARLMPIVARQSIFVAAIRAGKRRSLAHASNASARRSSSRPKRIHGAHCGGTLPSRGQAESPLHLGRRCTERTHLIPHRMRDGIEAQSERQQDISRGRGGFIPRSRKRMVTLTPRMERFSDILL